MTAFFSRGAGEKKRAAGRLSPQSGGPPPPSLKEERERGLGGGGEGGEQQQPRCVYDGGGRRWRRVCRAAPRGRLALLPATLRPHTSACCVGGRHGRGLYVGGGSWGGSNIYTGEGTRRAESCTARPGILPLHFLASDSPSFPLLLLGLLTVRGDEDSLDGGGADIRV